MDSDRYLKCVYLELFQRAHTHTRTQNKTSIITKNYLSRYEFNIILEPLFSNLKRFSSARIGKSEQRKIKKRPELITN